MNYKKKTIKQVKYYHLVQEIGKGASAKVYLAVDDRKDELVAVKAIPMESLKKDRGMTPQHYCLQSCRTRSPQESTCFHQ